MASIERRTTTNDEIRHTVRWRLHGRSKGHTFRRRSDAEAWKRKVEGDDLAGLQVDDDRIGRNPCRIKGAGAAVFVGLQGLPGDQGRPLGGLAGRRRRDRGAGRPAHPRSAPPRRHPGRRMPGITTKELMARIGHASPRAALIYQHATAERDRKVADFLNEEIADVVRLRTATNRSGCVDLVWNSSGGVDHGEGEDAPEQGEHGEAAPGIEPGYRALQALA